MFKKAESKQPNPNWVEKHQLLSLAIHRPWVSFSQPLREISFSILKSSAVRSLGSIIQNPWYIGFDLTKCHEQYINVVDCLEISFCKRTFHMHDFFEDHFLEEVGISVVFKSISIVNKEVWPLLISQQKMPWRIFGRVTILLWSEKIFPRAFA